MFNKDLLGCGVLQQILHWGDGEPVWLNSYYQRDFDFDKGARSWQIDFHNLKKKKHSGSMEKSQSTCICCTIV